MGKNQDLGSGITFWIRNTAYDGTVLYIQDHVTRHDKKLKNLEAALLNGKWYLP
jgi:hypothetical protein